MQQGSDIAPRATSTRMVAGLWWFFIHNTDACVHERQRKVNSLFTLVADGQIGDG